MSLKYLSLIAFAISCSACNFMRHENEVLYFSDGVEVVPIGDGNVVGVSVPPTPFEDRAFFVFPFLGDQLTAFEVVVNCNKVSHRIVKQYILSSDGREISVSKISGNEILGGSLGVAVKSSCSFNDRRNDGSLILLPLEKFVEIAEVGAVLDGPIVVPNR